MLKKSVLKITGIICLSLVYGACTLPNYGRRTESTATPPDYYGSNDTVNTARVQWRDFFTDPNLEALIDTALKNNQELNIVMQEINIAKNEVRARKGAYLPFVNGEVGAGVEKVGDFTRSGAVEHTDEIAPGKTFPNPLPDYYLGLTASWELDIWNKLRTARKSAILRYLSSVEGRNFMVTQLVAEIANSYYELMALDNQLQILQRNIEIQTNALEIVRLQKVAARVTELAVRRFEAEVLKNQSRQYYIVQNIVVVENRINFLVGRFPQPVKRSSEGFIDLVPAPVRAGIPPQLLRNRPDIRQAENMLAASKLDVNVARRNFYPTLMITAGVGYDAFNTSYLLKPESMIYSAFGHLVAPLVNRNAIKAEYFSANARQIQNVYEYERKILNAYIEVANQLSNISNLEKSYALRSKQVATLTTSIDISTGLFKSARADYMEVLLTQRDALESKFELIETKKQQMNAMVNVYQALGGGWN